MWRGWFEDTLGCCIFFAPGNSFMCGGVFVVLICVFDKEWGNNDRLWTSVLEVFESHKSLSLRQQK